MPDVTTIAVAALRADQSRLELIGRNAANASTPGYRRNVVAAVGFDSLIEAQAGAHAPQGASAPLLPHLRNGIDPTQAGLVLTGRPLDMAIEGPAYFAVARGQGIALTRAGGFRLDADGWLVNGRGDKVQGLKGDIRLGTQEDVKVDARGVLTVKGVVQDTLKLLAVPEGDSVSSDDGMILSSSSGDYVEPAAGAAVVRSGFLESSNATGVRESIGMVETARHFESVIRLLQGYDEVLGKAIQKLGEL